MDLKILQDVGSIERKQLLRDSASATEKFTYPRALDDAEIRHLKDEFTKNSITMAKHIEAKKEFMVEWKSETKPLTQAMDVQMTRIRSKVEEVTEEVFLMPEHDEEMMGYYNALGILVYQRPLMPEERQFSIIDQTRRTGTNK